MRQGSAVKRGIRHKTGMVFCWRDLLKPKYNSKSTNAVGLKQELKCGCYLLSPNRGHPASSLIFN